MALQDAPAGSLQLTGVVGLAALVWGLYQLRGPGRRGEDASLRGPSQTGRQPPRNSLTQAPKQAPSSTAQAKASAQLLPADHCLHVLLTPLP